MEVTFVAGADINDLLSFDAIGGNEEIRRAFPRISKDGSRR
ncbi:MAG: hypothetical protein A4E57_04508 [Syntrophorhabdaceae bacterium PtaU1.Bin034]|nr:MAG: hypothetical protein A4E57_04508 [Syntrophorhabdaceae bacterium PtaU1.Bin034]